MPVLKKSKSNLSINTMSIKKTKSFPIDINQGMIIPKIEELLKLEINKLKIQLSQFEIDRDIVKFQSEQNIVNDKIVSISTDIKEYEEFLKKAQLNAGICSGLTVLWLYAKWLSTQPRQNPLTPRDDEQWFFNMLETISCYSIDKVKWLDRENAVEWKIFITYVLSFQVSEEAYQCEQYELDKYLFDTNGNHPKKYLSIALLLKRDDLVDLLNLINYSNCLVYIGSNRHAMGLFKEENNNISVYNSNNSKKPKLLTDHYSAASSIFDGMHFSYYKPSPLVIYIFNMNNNSMAHSSTWQLLSNLNLKPYTPSSLNYFNGASAIQTAILSNCFDSFLYHFSYNYNQHYYDSYGDNAITLAIKKGRMAMFQYLFNYKYQNKNQYNKKGDTLLMLAILCNQIEIVKYMLADPLVDVNKSNKQFTETPLITSIIDGNLEVTKLLLRHPKINISQPVKDNKKSYYFAFEYRTKHPDSPIVQLLIDHMVQENKERNVKKIPISNIGFFNGSSHQNNNYRSIHTIESTVSKNRMLTY